MTSVVWAGIVFGPSSQLVATCSLINNIDIPSEMIRPHCDGTIVHAKALHYAVKVLLFQECLWL